MKKINQFFIDMFGEDLSDTKVFFISLTGRAGYYDPDDDVVYINSDYNTLTRELTLVHEYTHRMVLIKGWCISIDLEEEYCKHVTLLYVEQVFGAEAIELVKDLV